MGYFNQKPANLKLTHIETFLGFYNLSLLFELKQLAQKLFGINHIYQRELLIQFFHNLQTMKPFFKIFTNDSFKSFVIFPVVKARKEFGEYGACIVEVAILQELYFYSYRFFLPNYFLTYQKDFELQIKLQFIQSYSSQKLKKTFYSNQLLDQYKQANNQKKKIIQKHCQIEFKNKKRKAQSSPIQELNTLIISQSDTINYYQRMF